MLGMVTRIVPVKCRAMLSQNDSLTLTMAEKYLWGTKSLYHKCIMSTTPQFDLGFYQNGSPHTAWRVGKIVTESMQGGGGVDYGNDEDQFFQRRVGGDEDEEVPEVDDGEDAPASFK
jgi:hypothetical protein